MYRKSDLCIPRNETVLPRSQFLHSCICERLIYSQDRSALFGCRKIGRLILGIYNHSPIYVCGNWETEHYNSVLKITRPRSFNSADTKTGTRHLYCIFHRPFICSVMAGDRQGMGGQTCRWCCYITVDFATAESQNCFWIIQQMCHKMILFHNCSTIKFKSNE